MHYKCRTPFKDTCIFKKFIDSAYVELICAYICSKDSQNYNRAIFHTTKQKKELKKEIATHKFMHYSTYIHTYNYLYLHIHEYPTKNSLKYLLSNCSFFATAASWRTLFFFSVEKFFEIKCIFCVDKKYKIKYMGLCILRFRK